MARLSLLAAFLLVAGVSRAEAWGCEGHQAIAIIAERLLDASSLRAVNAALAASPIDRRLERFCGAEPDLMADAATWADDHRGEDPSTGAWHFVNLPRALNPASVDYTRYCVRGQCVIDAIVAQYRVLTTTSDPRARATALRFLIHLVGDVHQPLHAITNGDRGGNCLAIAMPGDPAHEQGNHNVSPNLHSVWDAGLLARYMRAQRLRDARALASRVAASITTAPAPMRPLTTAQVLAWARGSFEIARTVTYARLPVNVPVQPPGVGTLASCDDNNHVSRRLLALKETLTAPYEEVSIAAILPQLRIAGERLAAVLKGAFAGG